MHNACLCPKSPILAQDLDTQNPHVATGSVPEARLVGGQPRSTSRTCPDDVHRTAYRRNNDLGSAGSRRFRTRRPSSSRQGCGRSWRSLRTQRRTRVPPTRALRCASALLSGQVNHGHPAIAQTHPACLCNEVGTVAPPASTASASGSEDAIAISRLSHGCLSPPVRAGTTVGNHDFSNGVLRPRASRDFKPRRKPQYACLCSSQLVRA